MSERLSTRKSERNMAQNSTVPTFHDIYKRMCVDTNTPINNSILHGLKGQDIVLNLDQLLLEDYNSFSLLMENCMFTHFTMNGLEQYKCKKKYSKSKIEKQQFTMDPDFNQIFKFIVPNLQNSTETLMLKLHNVRLQKDSLDILSQAIAANNSIKEFHYNHSNLVCSDFDILSRGILQNQSLIVLDLSNNQLQNIGRQIGKILSTHSQRRDDMVWLFNLRGEEPDYEISLKGLCEINLQYNRIDDMCVKDLSYFLQYDGWTRSVNLRYNQIESEGIIEINNILDNNESLISLDMRDNPGFTTYYSQKIFQKLLRNIKNFKKSRLEQQLKRNEVSEFSDSKKLPQSGSKESYRSESQKYV